MHWRVVALIDFAVLVAFMVSLWMYDAPTWAMILLVYMATKPSRIAYAADLGALQLSIKASRSELP